MANKKPFLSWVGYKGDTQEDVAPSTSSVERIRELESQLADLRSRRDIRSLSREEFEVLATETALTMIKSAQIREAKALAQSDRLINDTAARAKEAITESQQKAEQILNQAEARGRKYLKAAESEAEDLVAEATEKSEELISEGESTAQELVSDAKRERSKIVSGAVREIDEYRQWLSGVITDAERLYRIQNQSLDAAEEAIRSSRERLTGSFSKLKELQSEILANLRDDGTPLITTPKKVSSKRTRKAIAAPKKSKK